MVPCNFEMVTVTCAGNFCPGYDKEDAAYTTEYEWEYCEGMHVGERQSPTSPIMRYNTDSLIGDNE